MTPNCECACPDCKKENCPCNVTYCMYPDCYLHCGDGVACARAEDIPEEQVHEELFRDVIGEGC